MNNFFLVKKINFLECSGKCLECVGNLNNCTVCALPGIRTIDNPPNCTCRGNRVGNNCECPVGKYDNGSSDNCTENCSIQCITCIN